MDIKSICPGCMADKGEEKICPKCGWKDGTEPDSPLHLKPGTILSGKYLIGRVLGHGGFGITYLAFDINLGTKLAVKEYFPQGMATRSPGDNLISVYSGGTKTQFEFGLEKFLDEARTLARFDEVPEVVTIKDYFRVNGTAYIVMSYIEGITLKEYLAQKGGTLSLDAVLTFILPILKALEQVHKVGILHRDVSPDNIFITKNFNVKLLDFGAARFAMGEQSKSLSVILKPGYAPEEQYRTKGKQGPWTDVYAVAATMYRALTGETPPEALDRLAEDELKPLSSFGLEIPAGIESSIVRALSLKAEDRYQSIQEFHVDLLQQSGVGSAANEILPQQGAWKEPFQPLNNESIKVLKVKNSVKDWKKTFVLPVRTYLDNFTKKKNNIILFAISGTVIALLIISISLYLGLSKRGNTQTQTIYSQSENAAGNLNNTNGFADKVPNNPVPFNAKPSETVSEVKNSAAPTSTGTNQNATDRQEPSPTLASIPSTDVSPTSAAKTTSKPATSTTSAPKAAETTQKLHLTGIATNLNANVSDRIVVDITAKSDSDIYAKGSCAGNKLFGKFECSGTGTYDKSIGILKMNLYGTINFGDDGSGFPSGTKTGFNMFILVNNNSATGTFAVGKIPPYTDFIQYGSIVFDSAN